MHTCISPRCRFSSTPRPRAPRNPAEVEAQCHANCDIDGCVFCKGDIYVGADICLDVSLDLDL